MSLPKELQHESVVESRNRCEPKFDCYHVVLDVDEVPVMYRSQWKDDWEILGATVEGDNLRLTLIERYTPPVWRRYAVGSVSAAVGIGYIALGEWMVSAGMMGETAQLAGTAVMAVALATAFAVVGKTLVDDFRGSFDAARP